MEPDVSCRAEDPPIPDSSSREKRKHATGRSRCIERSASRAAPRNEIQATPMPSSVDAAAAFTIPEAERSQETRKRKTSSEKSSANAQCLMEETRQAPGNRRIRFATSSSVSRSWQDRYA